MEIGSKLGIKKLKLVTPKKGEPFYLATVFEKVYNINNPVTKWETVFYANTYIFDKTLKLEEADFSLGVNTKDKYSFDNISNKANSIIRVLGFKYERHTQWKNNKLVKDDNGLPILKDIFYLTKISEGTRVWRTDEGLFKELERKVKAQKEKIAEQRQKNFQKDIEYRKKIKEIRSEIAVVEREKKKLEEFIQKQNDKVCEAKNLVKEANKQVMVVRRRNTITENKLEKTQNKLIEKAEEVKQVKKMKKNEMLEKAEEFNDFIYDEFQM